RDPDLRHLRARDVRHHPGGRPGGARRRGAGRAVPRLHPPHQRVAHRVRERRPDRARRSGAVRPPAGAGRRSDLRAHRRGAGRHAGARAQRAHPDLAVPAGRGRRAGARHLAGDLRVGAPAARPPPPGDGQRPRRMSGPGQAEGAAPPGGGGAAEHWDFVVVGSGFGGSVSALRLVEKGYRVLMLEQGRRLGAGDFPRTNWQLRRWLWMPALGWRGLFRMTFLRHVTAMTGVGVGGGSLVYANTLPVPGERFFQAPSWAHLADWQEELAPHYRTALRMLGAVENPHVTLPDEILREVARDMGRPEHVHPTQVAVYFGAPG